MNKKIVFNLQRRVVSHMALKAWTDIPHVSYLYEPDVTEFYDTFLELVREKTSTGRRLSFNTMMLRVIVEGLKAAPRLNAAVSYSHKKGKGWLRPFDAINICIPWLLPDGRMITPVLMNAESKDLDALADSIDILGAKIKNTDVDELLYQAVFADTVRELGKFHLGVFRRILSSKISFHRVKGLTGKAKKQYYSIPEEERLSAQNLISGTVTVSNIGSLYKEQQGRFGLLEIIPPQVFAVGLGAVQEKPGVCAAPGGGKKIDIRKFLPMCLVFDHRAVDFSALVPFLQTLDGIFSKPEIVRTW